MHGYGLISCLVGVARSIIYYLLEKKGIKIHFTIPLAFSVILITLGIITFQDAFSILPMIGTTAYTWALWQNNLSIFRFVAMIEPALMFVYDFHVGARVALLATAFEFVGAMVMRKRSVILQWLWVSRGDPESYIYLGRMSWASLSVESMMLRAA